MPSIKINEKIVNAFIKGLEDQQKQTKQLPQFEDIEWWDFLKLLFLNYLLAVQITWRKVQEFLFGFKWETISFWSNVRVLKSLIQEKRKIWYNIAKIEKNYRLENIIVIIDAINKHIEKTKKINPYLLYILIQMYILEIYTKVELMKIETVIFDNEMPIIFVNGIYHMLKELRKEKLIKRYNFSKKLDLINIYGISRDIAKQKDTFFYEKYGQWMSNDIYGQLTTFFLHEINVGDTLSVILDKLTLFFWASAIFYF